MSKSKSADELMSELNADPTFRARRREREEQRRNLEAELKRAEAPLVDALRTAGFEVHSVWELASSCRAYSEAIPILISHLDRPYPDRVREGIARALAVPQARQA